MNPKFKRNIQAILVAIITLLVAIPDVAIIGFENNLIRIGIVITAIFFILILGPNLPKP